MYYGVPKKHEKSNQPLQISKVTTARNHKSAEKERESQRPDIGVDADIANQLHANRISQQQLQQLQTRVYLQYKCNASIDTINNSHKHE